MNRNIIKRIVERNNNVISPIQYIGNNHPYKIYTILNLSISSSLFISNYTIAKTSIFVYIMYIMNNNIYLILIMLFFVIYPLLFIVLIHPFIIITIKNNLLSKSKNKGMIINNLVIITLSFISLINMYNIFIIVAYPLLSLIII